jgi:outer membrane protein
MGLALLACSSLVWAENLYQVYQHALQSDPVLQASEASYLATMENKPQALAALKPQVSLFASTSANLDHQNTVVSSGTSNFVNGGYTLSVSKSIYHNELDAQVSKANAGIAQAKSSLAVERQNLIIRVAEAYFSYLKAQDNLKFTSSEKEAIGRQLAQVNAYFEAGRSPITDVKEAQARYDSATSQQVSANQQLDIAKEEIKAITGRYYKHLDSARLNTRLIPPKPNKIEAWTQTALANSQQIAALKHAIDVAQSEVDRQRAGKDPTIDLVAKHNGSVNRLDIDSELFGASVGVQLNMPLYTGGLVDSGIRQSRHNLHQAQHQLEASKRQVTQQTRSSYLSVVSGIAQAKALQQALVSTKTAAQATQAGFEVGTRTAVDVLLSLRETFRAQRDYSVARYDYLLNSLRLKQATGLLKVQDLQQINAALQKRKS